jgi:hypothetical protein
MGMMASPGAETTVKRVCAWCGSVLGLTHWPWTGRTSITSHGVCSSCATRIQASRRAHPASALVTPGREGEPRRYH